MGLLPPLGFGMRCMSEVANSRGHLPVRSISFKSAAMASSNGSDQWASKEGAIASHPMLVVAGKVRAALRMSSALIGGSSE